TALRGHLPWGSLAAHVVASLGKQAQLPTRQGKGVAGPALVYRRPCIPGATAALRSVKLLPCWKRRCPFDPTSGSATCSRGVAAGSPSEVATPRPPTGAVGRAGGARQSGVGGIGAVLATLAH